MSADVKTQSKPVIENQISLTGGQLNKWVPLATLVVCICVVTALMAMLADGETKVGRLLVGGIVLGGVVALIVVFALSFSVEGSRRAVNRVMAYIIAGAFLLACLPLVSLLFDTIVKGVARFDGTFFSSTMRNVVLEGGGAIHAITGTLIVTGIATLISVPIGLFTSIYLVEYGTGGWLQRGITFLVDVMTGIPSIVAGLFAYSLFTLILGPSKSGLSGAVALCVLMIPYVVRNCEEIIRLVPDKLREASYALGVTKWRTIVKIVLPTSISGIVSGIIIAIARIIGETAPLLVTMGYTDSLNFNPIPTPDRPINEMTALPVMVYNQYMQAPGRFPEPAHARAWAGALVLVLIVMVLNLIGRWVSHKFAPKINR